MKPYNEETADLQDKAAFILSEIMNDNAPIGWERYRGYSYFIANNHELMRLLNKIEVEIVKQERYRARMRRGR